MDDDRPPLASPLSLSQPAVLQAPNENQGAAAPSETTGVDGVARESDTPESRAT